MKTAARTIRHARVRSRLSGTAIRPRLVVFRGTKTLAAQLIDDQAGKVLLTVRSPQAGLPAAAKLGAELAKLAKAKKLTSVVFDRAGYRYHGAVKAFGDAVREHGVTI